MVKRHLKRLNSPRSWKIKRKGIKFITKPNPGAHPFKLGTPLNLMLKDVFGYAKTTKEVKNILNNKEVIIDGVRRKDHRFIVGFMDTIAIPKIKAYFRVLLDKKGKLCFIPIKENEVKIKLCKITGKTSIKKKIQLNLYDGRNILIEKDNYNVGDTLVLGVPQQKIKDHIKFEKNVSILLIGGKHIGEIGKIQETKGIKVVYKGKLGLFETLKKYAFAVGKDEPVISLEKSEEK